MTKSSPTISPEGAAKLSELLHKVVDSREVPAVFFGATTADEELYFDQYGEKVFGQPESGQVDADTGM